MLCRIISSSVTVTIYLQLKFHSKDSQVNFNSAIFAKENFSLMLDISCGEMSHGSFEKKSFI